MSVSELYAILVLNHHLPPSYVMDSMEMYEVKALMDYSYYSHKDEWEQTRFISYVIAQVNSQKKLKMEDIVSFDWDENKKVHITSISNEDIERLKNKAKEYLNNG